MDLQMKEAAIEEGRSSEEEVKVVTKREEIRRRELPLLKRDLLGRSRESMRRNPKERMMVINWMKMDPRKLLQVPR